jgi:hypothetical protein
MKKPAAHQRLMDLVLSRMEQKCCPQGLNVILEELHWMGMTAITCEQLRSAVKADLSGSHPRLRAVAPDVYWLAEVNVPLGWSLYRDVRMLPCFYRRYPPQISWDDLDSPENILPYIQPSERRTESAPNGSR